MSLCITIKFFILCVIFVLTYSDNISKNNLVKGKISENLQLFNQQERSPLLDFYYLTNTPDEEAVMHQPGEIARLLDRRLKHVSKTDTRTKVKRSMRSSPKVWDHWGRWTPCSQTCGSGRMTRWRHCVSDGCATGEKEAQIKTCNNVAC